MPLPIRAGQVLDLMVQKGLGARPILFICHSLGGLLVKQILRKANDSPEPVKNDIARSTRAVLFLATPHAGADLASRISDFRDMFGATASIDDLRAHDAHLSDLFDWYCDNAPRLGIETATYYETRPIKGILPIVTSTSARSGVGANPIGLDEDHISIAKPRDADAQVCGAARSLLRKHVLFLQEILHAAPNRAVPSVHRIPRNLPPAPVEFFGRKSELNALSERLRLRKNTAVVGPAGLGKTALASQAVRAVVGLTADSLAASPYPDGVVFLDLYALGGTAERAWSSLADQLLGADFMTNLPAKSRATEACHARNLLLIIEGGEEADGRGGRTSVSELFDVLSPQNIWLLLTRVNTQAMPVESIDLKDALRRDDAGFLLDSLTKGRLTLKTRDEVLDLLEGHPLALTWAGCLLAREDEDPSELIRDWQSSQLPRLNNPTQAEHTLEWLFTRSTRGLDTAAAEALSCAGMLAHSSFPTEAIVQALGNSYTKKDISNALSALAKRGLLRRNADVWQFTHVLSYRFARTEANADFTRREYLAHWIRGDLMANLAVNLGGKEALAMTGILNHVAALLSADSKQRLWNSLAKYVLYDATDRLNQLGRLDVVKLALSAVEGWFEQLPPGTASEVKWLRERSILLSRKGDVLAFQGDMGRALEAYQSGAAIAKSIIELEPANILWQRDLSVSHNKIGDVLFARGDLEGAKKIYLAALDVAKSLAVAEPSEVDWQRDLVVSHHKVGNVMAVQENWTGALEMFRSALEISLSVAEKDPSNDAQRILSVSHHRVGDAQSAEGDPDGALESYLADLAIVKKLVVIDPSNTEWQRDLSVSYDRIAYIKYAQGDINGALESCSTGMDIRQNLSAADPTNTAWQSDVAASCLMVAGLHDANGDREAARGLVEQSLEISERLVQLDPSNRVWRHDLNRSRELAEHFRA